MTNFSKLNTLSDSANVSETFLKNVLLRDLICKVLQILAEVNLTCKVFKMLAEVNKVFNF